MEAEPALDCLVKSWIHPLLKPQGFSRRGSNFNKWAGPNCQVVSIERHRFHAVSVRTFHINLGVFYPRFHALEHSGPSPKSVLMSECALNLELGHLVDGRQRTWSLALLSEVPKVGQEVVGLLREHALPFLSKYANESQLTELVEHGKVPGLPEFQRLKLLAFRFAEKGKDSHARGVLEELRQRFDTAEGKPLVEDYIAKIERLLGG